MTNAWPEDNILMHPAVLRSTGGGMCPEQHEGQLVDGRWFYLRMRHSHAELGVGWCVDDAVADTIYGEGVSMELDDSRSDRGYFEDNTELRGVFDRLLQKRAPELAVG